MDDEEDKKVSSIGSIEEDQEGSEIRQGELRETFENKDVKELT